MIFSILGSKGFVGRNLADYLEARGHEVNRICRENEGVAPAHLGNVIYCIGLTADFRSRPFDTVEAHVCKLSRLLAAGKFTSLLYLSSTRVYEGIPPNTSADETMTLQTKPSLDGVYNISKLLGESLCLSQNNAKVRIARLSNVFGVGQNPTTFLASVLSEILQNGIVSIREARDSNKDYVPLDDILPLLESIAITGKERIYNLAGGRLLSHGELAEIVGRLTGGSIHFAEDGVLRQFPQIDISRIRREFGYAGANLKEQLKKLIEAMRNKQGERK